MANLTWLGGGNNKASNPSDWSTNTAPQPGDTLSVQGLPVFTMNVSGNDLAGDDVYIAGFQSATVNLTKHATMSSLVMFGVADTFNLSGRSSLALTVSRAPATINLSGNSSLNLGGIDRTTATVNISGRDTATINLTPVGQAGGGLRSIWRQERPGSAPCNITVNPAASSIASQYPVDRTRSSIMTGQAILDLQLSTQKLLASAACTLSRAPWSFSNQLAATSRLWPLRMSKLTYLMNSRAASAWRQRRAASTSRAWRMLTPSRSKTTY